MKITLIHPPWYMNPGEFLLKGEFSQCLGLGYVAGYLKLRGHQVEIIDALAEGANNIIKITHKGQTILRRGLSYEAIVAKISADTQLIGISVPFTNLAQVAKELSSLIKMKYPHIPIIAGGVHASTLPYDLLGKHIDYVIRGEGEIPMLQFASGKDPAEIKGLVHKNKGGFIDNGPSEQIEDLDQIPFPYRPAGLMETYLTYSPRGERLRRTLSIITSRGCPYDCLFCSVHPVSGYEWRGRSAGNVIQEIGYYIENYGVNHIEFEDDNLTWDAPRAEEIFDGIMGLSKKITWAVNNGLRVDTLSAKLIEKMKKSGCVQINLAIESGSQKVLDLMNKRLSLRKVEEIVEACNDFNIPTLGFFLVGFPGETKETFSETVRYIRRLKKGGLKRLSAMIVNAYPGTKLYNYCRGKGYLVKDIDEHIFVGGDYVSIITEDFDRNLVIYWREYLHGIYHPFRWEIKKMLRVILSPFISEKLISLYRALYGRLRLK